MSASKVPQKYEPNPVPAIREEIPPPSIVSQPLPPAVKEGDFPLTFYQKSVDVSDFIDFLSTINETPQSVFEAFEKSLRSQKETKGKCGMGKKLTLKESGLPTSIATIAGPKFTHVIKPCPEKESCYIAIACLSVFARNQKLLSAEKLALLVDQTRSCCQNLSIPASIAKKVERGLELLTEADSIEKLQEELLLPKNYQALLLAMRWMNLMVLIHYPELLTWVHPDGVDKYLKEDYLLELIRPDEGVSTYALLALMKALDSLCLLLVEEGKGTIKVHRPVERFVEKAAIYRSGGQFYLLEGSAL